MQEKRKKFWIIFSAVIASVLVVMLGFGMLTNLKTVSVEFRQRLPQGESRLDENILTKLEKDGEFEYGKGLLFANVKQSAEKIEKKNPFVKVEQVLRDFPNTAKVYVSERVPVCYAKRGSHYLVLDKEFKVLDKFDANADGTAYLEQNYLKGIYQTNMAVSGSLEAGDFVTDAENMALYKDIHSGIVGAQEGSYSNVKQLNIVSGSVNIVMKKHGVSFDDGIKIELDGTDDLMLKTFVALEFYETIDQTMTAQTIKLQKSNDANKYKAYIIAN